MRNYRPTPIWKVILTDILLGALALGLVVFFRLGLPMLRARQSTSAPRESAAPAAQTPVPETPSPTPEAAPIEAAPVTEAPAPAEAPESAAEPAATEAPAPTEDPRTPWQIRFADQFTEDVVETESSYTSPRTSIHITRGTVGEGDRQTVYYVADIYIASPEQFRAQTVKGELRYFSTQDAMEMDADAHAILAISGDFYSYQDRGFLMRNGVLYMDDQTYCDLCVLYEDGTMATYARDEYTVQEVLDRGAVQTWNFGPALLDAEGHVKPYYEVSTTVGYPNPRSAVGYYEPGHYCFVVAEGRLDDSYGLTIGELAQIFEDLGCRCAYNLDGGGSALMTFLHGRYSRQSNGADRDLGDLLVITEDGWEERR